MSRLPFPSSTTTRRNRCRRSDATPLASILRSGKSLCSNATPRTFVNRTTICGVLFTWSLPALTQVARTVSFCDHTIRDSRRLLLNRAFQPAEHGFKFRNSFAGVPVPFDIPFLPDATGAYGLCGGMSAAACDFYAFHRPIPETNSVPAKDTPLYAYLYERQLATLGDSGSYILKFLAWMALPDDGPYGTRRLTYREELPALQRELARARPTVIGLVYVSSRESLHVWENHQVVVYDAGETAGAGTSYTLNVYDPNFPRRDDITISCDRVRVGRWRVIFWWRNIYGLQCVQHVPGKADRPVRGFFLMRHSRRSPPDDL